MDYEAVIRQVAKTVGTLKSDGSLARMDSLNIIDFVVELEMAANVTIPAERVTPGVFETLESIVTLLKALHAEKKP
jgi:acyl carrier protein